MSVEKDIREAAIAAYEAAVAAGCTCKGTTAVSDYGDYVVANVWHDDSCPLSPDRP